jgi:xylulokinase
MNSNASRHYFIGLDVGTSSTKGLLVDTEGNVLAAASRDYPLDTPKPGWTEQDPSLWWEASREILQELCHQAPTAPAAVGLTGQMHGAVFLDACGEVIRPALLWNDQRTETQSAEIERRIGSEQLRTITGNPALTGFQAPKILWLREHEPHHYQQISQILLPKDYIRYRLSSTFATDVSDAAGTMLLDIEQRNWSDDILRELQIPRKWMPRVYESAEICARVSVEGAGSTGLVEGTPIVAGAGDNAAAAVGSGIVEENTALVSVGTSGVVFAHTKKAMPDPKGELHCFGHAVPGSYCLMGVSLAAGGSLKWFAREFASEEAEVARRLNGDHYDLLVSEAATVPAGAEGVFFLPYLSGERTPHMDPNARAAWLGLSFRHTRSHMLRAVLEGVAFALRDSLERIEQQDTRIEKLILVGGGVSNRLWRGIISAALDKPTALQPNQGGAAFGAAVLASVGAGVHESVGTAVKAMVAPVDAFETPDRVLASDYARLYKQFTRIYPALRAVL